MNSPTQRQLEVLRYLHSFTRRHGYPPTLREMRSTLGWRNLPVGRDHLRALHRKGLVRISEQTARGYRVTAEGRRFAETGGLIATVDPRVTWRARVEPDEDGVLRWVGPASEAAS